MRIALALLAAALIVWMLAVWLPGIANGSEISPTPDGVASTPAAGAIVAPPPALFPPTYQGHDAHWWHDVYVAQHRRTVALKRTLLARPSVEEALDLACTVYGDCATLWRRARCESHLRSLAANKASSARGLLQFLTTGPARRYGDHARVNGGTWATTPFFRFNVFSPYANALAAGWMIANGRGGEWTCR